MMVLEPGYSKARTRSQAVLSALVDLIPYAPSALKHAISPMDGVAYDQPSSLTTVVSVVYASRKGH